MEERLNIYNTTEFRRFKKMEMARAGVKTNYELRRNQNGTESEQVYCTRSQTPRQLVNIFIQGTTMSQSMMEYHLRASQPGELFSVVSEAEMAERGLTIEKIRALKTEEDLNAQIAEVIKKTDRRQAGVLEGPAASHDDEDEDDGEDERGHSKLSPFMRRKPAAKRKARPGRGRGTQRMGSPTPSSPGPTSVGMSPKRKRLKAGAASPKKRGATIKRRGGETDVGDMLEGASTPLKRENCGAEADMKGKDDGRTVASGSTVASTYDQTKHFFNHPDTMNGKYNKTDINKAWHNDQWDDHWRPWGSHLEHSTDGAVFLSLCKLRCLLSVGECQAPIVQTPG